MSLKDCMIKNGFTENEIDEMVGDKPLSEPQFIESMTKAQKLLREKTRRAKIQMLTIDSAMNTINSLNIYL